MLGDKVYVNLDVGNYLYTIHVDNMRRVGNSFLDRLVAPEHDTRQSSCDYIKIQRDGRLFGHIISYLQNSRASCLRGLSRKDINDLQVEADFYGLEGLIRLCNDALSYNLNSNSENLQILFGLDSMANRLALIDEPTLILNVDKFVELSFFESMDHMVTLCNLNRLPVLGYKSQESDQKRAFPLDLSSIITLIDQNMNIKHQLEVSRLTRIDEFFKKVLKLMISMTTLTGEGEPNEQIC